MKKWTAGFYDETGVIKLPARIMVMVCIFLLLLAGSVFLYHHSPEEKNWWLICLVYEVSGYYCPGCGAGRACFSILHGRFAQAFRYNPLLCLLLPWLALYLGACGVQWLLTGRETISRRIPIELAYVLLAVVLLYGVVRNIEVYPFTLLAPTQIE